MCGRYSRGATFGVSTVIGTVVYTWSRVRTCVHQLPSCVDFSQIPKVLAISFVRPATHFVILPLSPTLVRCKLLRRYTTQLACCSIQRFFVPAGPFRISRNGRPFLQGVGVSRVTYSTGVVQITSEDPVGRKLPTGV